MKKLTFLLLIALVLTIYSRAQTSKSKAPPVPYDPNKKYTVAELQFDLAILKDALVKIHPGLFWYQTEKEFEDNYATLKNSISRPMTEMEFHTLINPFIGNIKCGHTDLELSETFFNFFETKARFFPFRIRIIDSKIYVIKNYATDSTIAAGSEITTINGISADSILRALQPTQWADGDAKSYQRMARYFQFSLLRVFDYPDKYVLTIIAPNGNSRLIECEALNYETASKNASKRYPSNPNVKHEPFKFRLIDSLNTGVMRIDGFEGKGYEKFLANSFETLKNNGVKNLIIDLRGNSGGEDSYGRLLYSYIALKDYKFYDRLEVTMDDPNDTIFKYGKVPGEYISLKTLHACKIRETEKGKYDLKNQVSENLSEKPFKPHKDNFTGNVFVLVDDGSCSGTAEFSAITSYNKRAKFIGRETGGGYCGNSSGGFFLLTLPKTGIGMSIPLIKYYMAVEGPCGTGIKPDYPLKEDIKDYILNTDSDLLFTLDLINRTR
jgi:hypothetical protein